MYTSRACRQPGDGSFQREKLIEKRESHGEPIGRKADRLVITAVDCMISWVLCPWHFSFSRHPFLKMPLSLDPVCPCHLWILTVLPVACCLSGRLFDSDISFSCVSFLMLPLSLCPVCASYLWNLTTQLSCWQLCSPRPDILVSPDKLLSVR